MNWELYKRKLQKRLSTHESEVDIMELWSAIESEIQVEGKKKKRRFLFWFLFLGFGLIAGSLFHWQKFSIIANNNNQEKVEQVLNTPVETTEKLAKNNKKEIKNQTLPQQSESNKKKVSKKKVSKKVIDKKEVKSISKTLATKEGITLSTKKQEPEVTNLTEDKDPRNTKDITLIDEMPVAANYHEKQITSESRHLHSFLSTLSTIKNKGIIWEQQLKPLKVSFEVPFEKGSLMNNDFQRKDWDVQFYTSGGLSYAHKQLTLNNRDSPISPNYLALRDSLEQTLEAVHYGGGLNITHRSGLEFSIGLQKTTINEKFSYVDSRFEVDSVFGVTDIRITPNQDTIYKEGHLVVNRTITRTIRDFNKYQLLEIPIMVGYTRQLGKYNFGIQGGLLLNLSLKSKGRIPDIESREFINLKTNQKNLFKSKIGLGYRFGIMLNRPILPKVSIGISSSFQYYPSDFANSNNGTSQKYWLIGGAIKLSYQL